MKLTAILCHLTKYLVLILFVFLYLLISSNAKAVEKQTSVSASVPNTTPPSIPLLIAPENRSFLTVTTPTFIWKASTSLVALSHYQFYLDDVLQYDFIPLSTFSNEEYSLDFNVITQTYSLTPKIPITDGTHSWKIVSIAANNTFTNSATWIFHLDSQAPLLLIEKIDTLITQISSLNASSVPTNVLELKNNEPVMSGLGEPGASVTVTITVEGQTPYQEFFTVGTDGTWEFQLPTLPRDNITNITFVILDDAGNASSILNVKILISKEVFIFPESNEEPSVFTQLQIPKLIIPVTYPLETVKTATSSIISKIPARITNAVTFIADLAKKVVLVPLKFIAPSGALIATAAIPVFSLVSLLLQLGPKLFYQAVLRLLQTLGLLPHPDPQGLVFDSKSNQPVSFAILNITQVNVVEGTSPIKETVVTNTHGLYQGLTLPNGTYKVEVKHQDYEFPTNIERPRYLSFKDFYKGEIFTVSKDTPPLFLIPIDYSSDEKKVEKTATSLLKLILKRYSFNKLRLPLFILSFFITLFYPTFMNILVLGAYGLIFGRDYISSKRRPDLFGVISDQNRVPIPQATVRLYERDSARLVTIIQTGEDGSFSAFIEPGKYLINIMKNGYIWDELAAQSYNEITMTGETQRHNVTMRTIHT